MSWTNVFAGFAVLAIVIGVICGMGQAFARPADTDAGHSALGTHMPVLKGISSNIPSMRPVPTLFPVPDNGKKLQIVEGYTDKTTYTAGDKVTGTVVLKNTGSVTIDDVTIYASAYKDTPMGYVYVGSKSETLSNLKITPGMVKKLDRHVTIPGKYKKLLSGVYSGDYRIDVTVYSGATQIGSFTTYVTIK